ncbi:cation-independent mannose-6-phosphate receptor-like isoform X2 [Saccopteryx leptura]|uniref:cation-independent mannose-6-phosphate receptor-like isoform X2 n=1 Tax=Saccopteryx leptura TaxID=249018 RepID=UPI00339BC75D
MISPEVGSACPWPWPGPRSSLAKSEDGPDGNWYALDSAGEHNMWRKYYINVCRPLRPVPCCDGYVATCQMRYENCQGVFTKVVSISNFGMATMGPAVEVSDTLLLEYLNGSACTTSDGVQTTYITRIHLACSRSSLVRKHISDLYEDLRDGHNLICLLEVLSGTKLVSCSLLLMCDLTGGALFLSVHRAEWRGKRPSLLSL